MLEPYKSICCIHSLDQSTKFLESFKDIVPDSYIVIDTSEDSLQNVIEKVKSLEPISLILFLGHGHSRGIYCPVLEGLEKRIFIDIKMGEEMFRNHDLILLSCKSADFIQSLSSYNGAIGFGNIISSPEESSAEAEYTGKYRDLAEDDIHYFNNSYVNAIAKCFKFLIQGNILFREMPDYISFYINKEINLILRQKNKANKTEVATLLFEFRNDMIFSIRTPFE